MGLTNEQLHVGALDKFSEISRQLKKIKRDLRAYATSPAKWTNAPKKRSSKIKTVVDNICIGYNFDPVIMERKR